MKEIVVVKIGGTNFASIEDALECLNCRVFYAQNKNDIINAERVLLPGVGSMKAISENIEMKFTINVRVIIFKVFDIFT